MESKNKEINSGVFKVQGKTEISILVDLLKYKPSSKVNKKDFVIVRDLAKTIKEISITSENIEKIKLWKKHNSLKKTRPLILCFPENAFEELIPYSSLKSQDPYIREYEWFLRSIISHNKIFEDDYAITSRLKVPPRFSLAQVGMEEVWVAHGRGRTLTFENQIINEEDNKKFKPGNFFLNVKGTKRDYEYISEIFGDILNVEIFWGMIPTVFDLNLIRHFFNLRGISKAYVDLIDRPKWVHEILDYFTKYTLELIKDIEKKGYLGLNNKDDYIGSGSVGWTDELPKGGYNGTARLKDLWGFAEGQDATGLSPTMLEHFFLPYQIKLLENFGLNYYGCCEDLTKKFQIIKKIPNLRKISVSPFTDIKIAANEIENKYIFAWKPNPSDLAWDTFDANLIRNKISQGFDITKDCIVEIIMKDTHTLRNDPSRMSKWVMIAKEEALKYEV